MSHSINTHPEKLRPRLRQKGRHFRRTRRFGLMAVFLVGALAALGVAALIMLVLNSVELQLL